MNKKKYRVSGMTCAACSARVEKAVSSLGGVEVCEVNLLLGTMSVKGEVSEDTVISAVERAGYHASGYESEILENGKNSENNGSYGADSAEDSEAKAQKRETIARLAASSVLLILLMYISMGHVMWGWGLPSFLSVNVIAIAVTELILSGLIMVINKHFFINGIKGIVRLAPNMDTLVSLGSLASYVYSVVVVYLMSADVLRGDTAAAHDKLHGLYFESAAMILVLITVGKLLEKIAKGKTTSAIRALMDLSPKMACVERDGKEVEIPVKDIRVGDVFIVKRGDNLPADGRIAFGEVSLNEAVLTGESIPVDKTVGDSVLGATTVLSGYAKIEALKVGEETAIAEVIKMVKEASGSKAPVAKAADKVAGAFVPAVLIISLITLVVWLIAGATVGDALSRAVTVLVISCPCALGLATPVAIMVGSGVGAKHGILFKTAASLEAAGKVEIVAFDKTGTVTEGRPEVAEIISGSVGEEELMRLAVSLEEKSEHPLARAIMAYRDEKNITRVPTCDSFSTSLGGVSGTVSGEAVYGGNRSFVEKNAAASLDGNLLNRFTQLSDEGKTVLIFAKHGVVLGLIAISDRIRDDSAAAVKTLNSMGIQTVMITGDNLRSAEYVAGRVGIKRVISEVLPADKARVIKELKSEGKLVAMVGDGINDSVALTEADVGIAVGKGADVAIDSADVVLTRVGLSGVPAAIKLGKRVLLNIYENLFWAFCYNIVGIPLAAGAFIPLLGWTLAPMFGAVAMSVSSLLVVSNSLRLNLYNPMRTAKNANKGFQNSSKNEVNNIIKSDDREEKQMSTVIIKIEGMMCSHCSGRVKSALEACELVALADVSHERADAIVTLAAGLENNTAIKAALEKIVTEAGYKVLG